MRGMTRLLFIMPIWTALSQRSSSDWHMVSQKTLSGGRSEGTAEGASRASKREPTRPLPNGRRSGWGMPSLAAR